MATYTYDLSDPAGSSIVVTASDTPTTITTQSGTSYTGYAITGVSGTFNGANITGLSGASGAYSVNPTDSFEFQDNAIFASGQGDNGSLDGIDTDGIAFTADDGNTYNIYYNTDNLTYDSENTTTGTQVSNSQPVTVQSTNAPCFASGTRVRTSRGELAVEDLSVGDVVVTCSGEHRPITWLGHSRTNCHRHPRPHEVLPVRIAAHAFGESRPARDLFVSPGHSICVDVLGEVLIPAIALVNGSTIQQVEVDEVTYWHVELDSHDVILAENLPAESYLDMGNRGFFRQADVVDLTAGPDSDPAQRTHADFCRPFHAAGPLVEVVRTQLQKRAEANGWSLTNDLDLHLVVDGRRLDPVVRGLAARFEVPANAKDVWLVSPTARPSDVIGTGDSRDLGLYISALRIDDGFDTRDVAIDDPLLCLGFHSVEEGSRRWTTGHARLPAALWEGCQDSFYLRVELAGMPLPRWAAPAAEAVVAERPRLAIVA